MQLYSHGDPTSEEQELLEDFNRVRADPAGEGRLEDFNRVRADPAGEGRFLADWLRTTPIGQGVIKSYGTNPDQVASDLAAYPPQPPVAMNVQLLAAARAHSRDIAEHNGVYPPGGGHSGYDGSTPDSRVAATGYVGGIGTGSISGGVSGEIAGPGQDDVMANYAAYLVDWGNPGFGHRQIIMAAQREVGVGNALKPASFQSRTPLVNTSDFGVDGYEANVVGHKVVLSAPAPSLLVGVAYRDGNANGRYDAGEGVASVSVTVDGGRYYAVTSASGGYALPLVRADGTNFQGAATVRLRGLPGEAERVQTITVGTAYDGINRVTYLTNARLDAVAGATAAAPKKVAVQVDHGGQISRAAGGKVVVSVRRLDPTNLTRSLTVKLKTAGSAVSGVDYRPLPRTLTIPAGAVKARLKVRPLTTGAEPEAAVTLVLGIGGASGQTTIQIVP